MDATRLYTVVDRRFKTMDQKEQKGVRNAEGVAHPLVDGATGPIAQRLLKSNFTYPSFARRNPDSS
jgi:hypothetical protein